MDTLLMSKRVSDDTSYAYELLSLSGLMDTEWYRARAQLTSNDDVITHYLEYGWKNGINPCADFEGEFLLPYYAASGLDEAPAITWLKLLARLGRRPPSNKKEAEFFAAQIRNDPLFDEAYYAQRLPSHLDAALHYVLLGELLGWRPCPSFSPDFYLEQYQDIVDHRLSPLQHYIAHGQYEGRHIAPAVDRLEFPSISGEGKPTIVVVVHEASRTGAPLLGLAVAQELQKKYNVISLLLWGGILEPQFREISAAVIGPLMLAERTAGEMTRLAEKVARVYRPLYVVANSIETHLVVPAFAKFGVPAVALVHEFASYTRPLARMRDVFDWASHIVFPASIVKQSSVASFPSLARRRGVHILAQGPVKLPSVNEINDHREDKTEAQENLERVLFEVEEQGEFLVVGLGTIHIRKGVDLFIAAAATARRLAPELPFKFVFIGDGYNPSDDSSYSVYLAEQIIQSGLEDCLVIIDSVENLEPVYDRADMFFMSSRLDPQPNVGIDAVTRGLPTVCFEGACGTAEILSTDQLTSSLIVPHLDSHMAGEAIIKVARDPALLTRLRVETAKVGSVSYNMAHYIDKIDKWGREAHAALAPRNLETLVQSQLIDRELALPVGVHAPGVFGLERYVEHQWNVVGLSANQTSNPHFRRPSPGFHPQIYAQAHFEDCVTRGDNPLAHWIRAGQMLGPWIRPVFSPGETACVASKLQRVVLHGHFYYVDDVPDLLRRLASNMTSCDLILTTDTDRKAEVLAKMTSGYLGVVDIRVMPNSGRDIGPLLTGLGAELIHSSYDVIGHIHGKKSAGINTDMGRVWRDFLWDNLIGGSAPMLDVAVAAFADNPDIGLLMTEDPHLVGWDSNFEIAQEIATQMGIKEPLDEFFDFPLGTMFWARPQALRPLVELGLKWEDYPSEPLANDGTLLHALERLVPFSVRKAGLSVGGLRAPGTAW